MFNSRIFLKLYAGYVVIILFCITIISLMIARQMQQDSLLDIENSLNSQAIILRDSIYKDLASAQIESLQQHITQMSHDLETRVTIINESGIVLADSERNPSSMDNHLNRPEIQQAHQYGSGVVTRYSQTLSKDMRYLALTIDNNNKNFGYIRVALPLAVIDHRLNHLRNVVIVAAILTAIIALLLGFWIVRSFAYPLRQMTDMAQLLSSGNYKQRLTIDRQDEIGVLATTLNTLANNAAQRDAVRRDFVANASHELKTPVTAIQGVAETLLEEDNMDTEIRRRFLQKIYDQSLRLSRLVSDLLALSRLEDDDIEIAKPVSINEIMTGSFNSLQPAAKEKMVSLKMELPEDDIVLSGDEKSLDQMLINLIDNAIKYTPAQGHITLRLETKNDQAIIEVEDDGIGIEATEQQRVFERFYRIDKARSQTLGSSGLGLSIVKHIAIKHHGNVTLESSLGNGSIFRVTLPLNNS